MITQPVAQHGDHPATVGYETPPQSLAAERHGPYHLVRHDRGGIRITGVYRTIWGRWRRAVWLTAVAGMALLMLGAFIDGFLGRTIVIDLTRNPPVFGGSAASLLGIALLALALVAWLAFRAATWRLLHRLEIDAGPEELMIRQEWPSGQQFAGRWNPTDVRRVIAERHTLTVEPREGEPLELTIGGPWTAPFWLADRIGESTGIATASVGRESTD